MQRRILTAAALLFIWGTLSAHATDPAEGIRDAYASGSTQAHAAMVENEARLNQLIESMHREMSLLATTKDRKERKQLMGMHRNHLHEMLMLLRQTGGDSLARMIDEHVAVSADAMPMSNSQSTHDDKTLSRLEKRLDMLQIVMEAMLDHLTMQGRSR